MKQSSQRGVYHRTVYQAGLTSRADTIHQGPWLACAASPVTNPFPAPQKHKRSKSGINCNDRGQLKTLKWNFTVLVFVKAAKTMYI